MIEESNALETIAEISATISGFAALASVLGEDPESKGQRFVRLRGVVSNGLLMTFCALIPVAFQHVGIADENMWRLTGAIALPLTWLAVYRNTRRSVSSGIKLNEEASYVGFAFLGVSQISLVAVTSGVFPDIAGFLYIVFLLVALATIAIDFLDLLDKLFSRPH